MSDKSLMRLDQSDVALRIGSPVGMESGVKQVIIRHCGFELYNTRPYHNYENWSDGYIILSHKEGKAMEIDWFFDNYGSPIKDRDKNFIVVSREDLDDAAILLIEQLGTKEKVVNWCNAHLNKGTNRAMSLRKRFSDRS